MDAEWIKEFPGAISVCDREGKIIALNDRACESFAQEGGAGLIGQNALDCHPEAARLKMQALLEKQVQNIYTIEKNGVKKLVYQTPWYQDGVFAGLVEMVLEIPLEMPHFIRQSAGEAV
jgi:transcriptional regulator with PAS, ATPase and Fis domain